MFDPSKHKPQVIVSPTCIPHIILCDATGAEVTPAYATSYSAGIDLFAAEECGNCCLLASRPAILVPVGLWILRSYVRANSDGSITVPELQIRDKSGRALKTELRVANAPGTIDCDFPAQIQVLIESRGADRFVPQIPVGYAIAQAVPGTVIRAASAPVERTGGFGSTKARTKLKIV
jgi:dUTP pyrophosphatase